MRKQKTPSDLAVEVRREIEVMLRISDPEFYLSAFERDRIEQIVRKKVEEAQNLVSASVESVESPSGEQTGDDYAQMTLRKRQALNECDLYCAPTSLFETAFEAGWMAHSRESQIPARSTESTVTRENKDLGYQT